MEREDFNGMNLNEDISDEDFNKIVEIYEQVKDKISKEDFISVFNENKKESDFAFFSDVDFAETILNSLGTEENEILDEVSGNVLKISDVEVGNENFDIVARVMSISNSRAFVSGKGRDGKLCNLEVADNTGRVRVVLWTQNVKHVKHISEGDIVRIGDIECREGYQGGKEFTLNPRSSIKRLEEGSRDYPNDIDLYPDYYEEFTAISDLRPNEQANIRGRLIRYPTPHKFNSNGRDGRVVEKLIPLMISNALEDKELPVYGDGKNIRDWLHVYDHCSAIDLVLHKGRIGEVYNIGGHNEKQNIEIVKLILKELGKSESLIKFVTDRLGHDRRYAIDSTKISEELGWKPKYTFETGIVETIQWYLDNQDWTNKIRSGEYQEYYEKMYGNR